MTQRHRPPARDLSGPLKAKRGKRAAPKKSRRKQNETASLQLGSRSLHLTYVQKRMADDGRLALPSSGIRFRSRDLSDRFLEFLGGAESDLLARLDLNGLSGGGIATHARGALPHL